MAFNVNYVRLMDLIDFCSNDYLGFARSVELKSAIQEAGADHTTGVTEQRAPGY